jgi:hypothetical protein
MSGHLLRGMDDPVLHKSRKANHSDKRQRENHLRGGEGRRRKLANAGLSIGFQARPGTFYACFFLLTYQCADLFNPLRQIAGFFIGLYRSS